MRAILEQRFVLSLALAAIVGTLGRAHLPWPHDNPFLVLLYLHKPVVYDALAYAYATLWYSTPFLSFSALFAALYIFILDRPEATVYLPLPPYPAPATRSRPSLIIGEQHHTLSRERAAHPSWLTIPEPGLFTGVLVLGAIGSGKTSACMYPAAEQLLGWAADDPQRRLAGLVLEVKGDFCKHIAAILTRHGRADDYVELSVGGTYCYNPIAGNLDPFAIAYSLATLINQLYGRSKEPFWQQAYTHLVKNIIAAAHLADGYTTLAEVYRYSISPDDLQALIDRARGRHGPGDMVVTRATFAQYEEQLSTLASWVIDAGDVVRAPYRDELAHALRTHRIPFQVPDRTAADPTQADAREQFEAVELWYREEWLRLEPRLRTSIVEGIAVVLSLFADSPPVRRTFCPPKEAYAESSTYPLRTLPPLTTLIERGHVLALNFPMSINPGLARFLGTLLKQDFQRAMLQRIPRLEAGTNPSQRAVLLLIDEYQYFATTGGTDPSGDERFFALSRQARCMPILATQSISSLQAAVGDDMTCRALVQCLRTLVILSLNCTHTAQLVADRAGRAYQLRPQFTIAEAGQDASVSLLTGKTASDKTTTTITKHYNFQMDYLFQPRAFLELKNAQAIVMPYDGAHPLSPQYCFLKPYFLDVQTSYFDHVAKGRL